MITVLAVLTLIAALVGAPMVLGRKIPWTTFGKTGKMLFQIAGIACLTVGVSVGIAFACIGIYKLGAIVVDESEMRRVPAGHESDACLRATERHRILVAQYKSVNAEALRTKKLDLLEEADALKDKRDNADYDEYSACYKYGGD